MDELLVILVVSYCHISCSSLLTLIQCRIVLELKNVKLEISRRTLFSGVAITLIDKLE